MACLPFWGVVLPAFFVAARLKKDLEEYSHDKVLFLIAPLGAALVTLSMLVALITPRGTFMPAINNPHLTKHLPDNVTVFTASLIILFVFIFVILLTSFAGTLLGGYLKKLSWFQYGRTTMLVIASAVLFILLITNSNQVQNLNFPENKVSMMTYVINVVHSFADSLFPGNQDTKVSGTFWRRLGWLDTYLPLTLVNILRVATGAGFSLLLYQSLKKSKYPWQSFFAAANVFGVLTCVATIAALYHIVGYNVNSRYLIIAYLFTVLLASEGFRQFFSESHLARVPRTGLLTVFCLLAVAIQSITWNAVLNRYF
jgi:hypothetical protein